jgi:protoporphyrinogen IX oxidase
MEYYLYIKSVHIVFVVSWMAGLFYIVRLFIYHIEANDKPEAERDFLHPQYQLMEKRLWNIITVPAMALTLLSGASMIYINPYLLKMDWMLVKLGFVAGLLIYHFICQRIIAQLKNGIYNWTSTQLRFWNELATILLVAIVFTVVRKTASDWLYGLIGLFIFIVVIMSAVKIYKYFRTK